MNVCVCGRALSSHPSTCPYSVRMPFTFGASIITTHSVPGAWHNIKLDEYSYLGALTAFSMALHWCHTHIIFMFITIFYYFSRGNFDGLHFVHIEMMTSVTTTLCELNSISNACIQPYQPWWWRESTQGKDQMKYSKWRTKAQHISIKMKEKTSTMFHMCISFMYFRNKISDSLPPIEFNYTWRSIL